MRFFGIFKVLMPAAFILILIQPSFAYTDHSLPRVMKKCIKCHPRAQPTHLLSRPDKMPEGWKGGTSGKMLCITCHDCTSGICTLKKEATELCQACHDCTTGMACVLGIAHLGNTIKDSSQHRNCLSCHDGYMGNARVAPGMVPGDHKVNVLYLKKKGYKTLPDRRIILPNGRVTCISCHNPYKSDHTRLVKSNEGGRLCLGCHVK